MRMSNLDFRLCKCVPDPLCKHGLASLLAWASFWCGGVPAGAGEQLEVVGSSTVYPFTTVVAERFGHAGGDSTPKVEATGTGGGMKLLCAGVGSAYPDIANASRAIKDSEIGLCASNGVSSPLEVQIGLDGIVIAQSARAEVLSLSRQQLFLALARDLPDRAGILHPNPHTRWSDIDPALPAKEIRVYGPPPTSGTRDAFVELVMEEGCLAVPGMAFLKNKDADLHAVACAAMREDGAFIEAGENDNLIIQRLVSNPDTLGIFGYSFLEENLDKVSGVAIDGTVPGFEAIEAGEYPLARPLFVYVKTEHGAFKPDLMKFVEFYVSEDALGPAGYLVDRGLVPLSPPQRDKMRTVVRLARW